MRRSIVPTASMPSIQALHDEFERFIFDVSRDDATHVIVLSGAGKAFSAGGDLEQMQRLVDQPHLMYPEAGIAKRLIASFLDIPQPVIAKVNGAAMGLGSTLALFCDISFAANHAKIADPHVKVGFVAGDGGAVIWPQLIGYARAKQYLLTGDVITGEEAARIGLVNSRVRPTNSMRRSTRTRSAWPAARGARCNGRRRPSTSD